LTFGKYLNPLTICQLQKPERDAILAAYSETCSQITRYRDREWQNVILFLAALTTMVAFVVANTIAAKRFQVQFEFAFIAMAAANIFYTCFAHTRLTEMSSAQKRIPQELPSPSI
jgi:uncharacterized membrane protein YjjP (DUF1212 family)